MKREYYQSALDHIDSYWKEITFDAPEDKGIHIGLPNPYIAPSRDLFHQDQFYWDTYFTALGLVVSDKVPLAKGMVDNLAFLYRRFGIMPLRNRLYNLGTSQPPLFTSMAFEVYHATKDKDWLVRVSEVAEHELDDYWIGKKRSEHRAVYEGLSRYCDHFMTHMTAEHESGWDMTSRFNDRALDHLPIDLNTYLYRYEADLCEIHGTFGDKKKENVYRTRAEERKNTMNDLMWDEEKGFFFDYDFKEKRRSEFFSLAGFTPLWAKFASMEQAERMRENLSIFEEQGGLAVTQKEGLSEEYRQWDYPNGWASMHWIVIRGLKNYGFDEDAERITRKWLDTNFKVFQETGKFWEKYNVVDESIGKDGRYVTQDGFGWTNAVFVRLIHDWCKEDPTCVIPADESYPQKQPSFSK